MKKQVKLLKKLSCFLRTLNSTKVLFILNSRKQSNGKIHNMKTECPHCGQHYEVDEEYIGQIAKCISCNQEFVIEKISSDVAVQENFAQKQPAENRTISKESVINKPKNIEKTKMDTVNQKGFWILVWFWLFFLFDLLLINSCVVDTTAPEYEGPPCLVEWTRYADKVEADEIKQEQKLWNDIRNY